MEALESGVFRSDLPTRFKCKESAYQGLIDCLDRDLSYALTHEAGWDMADVANYDEVKAEITQMLVSLRDAPNRYATARQSDAWLWGISAGRAHLYYTVPSWL